MRTVRFGVIGCGLMGREFGSAAARWCHLQNPAARPEIVAVCDTKEELTRWFAGNLPSVRQVTADYRALLTNPEVEAVYIAVPHHLHADLYCAAIEAGKSLMGEKPFGIDQAASDRIMACLAAHPKAFARCSSESVYFPAVQRIGAMLEADAFGRILEVNSGFLHSSDLDPAKPINWKRMLAFNGEYGAMGDLGMHACHVPFRAGWYPRDVRAVLSKVVSQRPDGKGGTAPCETWDNATLLCTATDQSGAPFPLTIKTQRIAPGHKNTWYLEVYGTKASARWTSKQINTLEVLEYKGGEQAWEVMDMGHEMAFKTITGGIFQAGFSDSILQMWAAFLHEMTLGQPLPKYAGCATPAEAAASHRLFTAALRSQANGTTEKVAR
jgi:predicted dehydrogenase